MDDRKFEPKMLRSGISLLGLNCPPGHTDQFCVEFERAWLSLPAIARLVVGEFNAASPVTVVVQPSSYPTAGQVRRTRDRFQVTFNWSVFQLAPPGFSEAIIAHEIGHLLMHALYEPSHRDPLAHGGIQASEFVNRHLQESWGFQPDPIQEWIITEVPHRLSGGSIPKKSRDEYLKMEEDYLLDWSKNMGCPEGDKVCAESQLVELITRTRPYIEIATESDSQVDRMRKPVLDSLRKRLSQ
jgi:hypothetical protein